jgi:hypothetical protein
MHQPVAYRKKKLKELLLSFRVVRGMFLLRHSQLLMLMSLNVQEVGDAVQKKVTQE